MAFNEKNVTRAVSNYQKKYRSEKIKNYEEDKIDLAIKDFLGRTGGDYEQYVYNRVMNANKPKWTAPSQSFVQQPALSQQDRWLSMVQGMTDEQIRAQVQQFHPTGPTPQEVMAGGVKPEYKHTAQTAMQNPYAVSNSQFDTASDWADAAGNALQAANKAYNTFVPVRTAKSGTETDEEALWHVINQSVMADKPDDMSDSDWAGLRIRVGDLGQFTGWLDFYKANYGKYSGKADTTMVRAMSRGEREDAAYNALRAKEYTAAVNNAQKAQEAWERAYINNNGEMPTFKGKMALGQVGALADAGLMPKLPTGQADKAAFDAAVAREIANKQPLDPYQEWLQSYYQSNTLLGIDEQMDANKRRMADLTTGQTYGQEQGSAYLRDAAEYERLKGMVAKGQGFDTFTPEQRELWNAYQSGNGLEWSNDRYAKGNKTYEKAAVDNEVLSANRANIVAQRNYQAAAGQPDFKANSVRDEAQKDDLYNFVNDNVGSKRRANEVFGIASTITPEGEWLDKGYGFLNRNEIAYYNYIVKTQGLEAGQRVLDELAPELALRRAKDVAEDAGAFAKKYGGWSTLATYGTNLVSGLTAPFRAVDAMLNPDHSYLSSMYDNQVFTDKVREVRGAEWGKATDKWQISLGDWKIEFGPELGQYLYGLQTSGGDMLTAMAVGKGVQLAGGSAAAMKNTVQAIMSSEAGGSTMYQAMESGIDPRKAVVLGLGSAAIEALTEKYSIEALLKKPDLIRTYLAQNIITEGSEEGASNLLNLAWDTMVLGDQGDIMTAYNAALEENGGNEKAAARTVLLDKLAELGLDVLGGSIMGGGMASVPSVTTAVKRGKVGKTINTNNTYNQLRDIAAAMDKDTSAYKIANEATKDGKISNAQAGRLYSALMETLDEQSAATIKEAQVREVTQRLRDLGETGNIGAVADALQQLWMGQRLSSDQRKAISTSRYGQQVANELFALDGDWAKSAADRVQQAQQRNAMTTARAQHLASKSFRAAENAEASKLVAKDASVKYAESESETAFNAKAIVDGEEGEVIGVKDVADGAPVFTVKVGDREQDVAMADLRLDSYNMAVVANAMRGMTAQAANEMLDFYKASSGISGAAFARGWQVAYNAGRTALGMGYVNTNRLASALSQNAREAAYAAGEQQYQGEKPAAQETAPKAPRGKGKVTFEKGTDLRTSKLTRGQRSAIGVARMLAQITGINFEFYRSTADKDGRYTRANGSYDPKTNTIALDLNAGKNSATDNAQFAILRTASHELTHYIAQNSPDMYRRLQTFVLDNLIERGKSMDMLIADQIARAKESGITIDEATAIEEVVADACEMMLRDSKAVETLAEKDNGLFVHIRNWLRKFYGQLKQAFDGLGASRLEAIALTEEDKDGTIRYIEGLQELWDQALVAAVEGGREYKQEHKVKYALRDSSGNVIDLTEDAVEENKRYLSAVNRGDMDTAQRMVDEAAEKAGYTVKAYHGTKSSFTVFDKDKIGTGATLFASQGKGFYFTANDSVARNTYASGEGKVVAARLKMEKPFVFTDKKNNEANRLLNEFAERYGRSFRVEDYSNYVNFEQRTGSVISRIVKGDGEAFTKFLQSRGYDGITYTAYNYDLGQADMTYVVFDPNQIKSADPVTYDDNGEVIPLSERFNREDDDIRFQARDYSSLSEREILDGADPNAFKNAGSKAYLKRYQAALREREKLQDKLTGYQEEALKEGISRADREAAEARAKIAETQLARQEEKLSKLEGEPEFQRALAAERQTITEAVKGMTPEKVAAQIERLEKEKARIATASAEELDNMSLALEMNLGRKAAKEARKAEERMTKQAERAEQKLAEADERIESLKEQNQELRQEMKHAAKEAKAQSDWDVAAKELALEMNLGRKREIMRKAYERRIATLKSKSAQKLAAAYQQGRNRLERYKERTKDTQSRSALRDRIKRKVHDLNKLLTRESDTKHVPQELKAAAAEFLKAFTDDTSVFAKGALDELRYAYDKIREENVDEVGAISQLYDRDIAVIMETLRPTIDGKRLSELTQQETQDVLDMVDYFTHIIKSANSIFFEGRRASISTLGKESIDQSENEKRFKGADNPVANLLRSGMMTPAYFFKKLGGSMKKLYDGLKTGEMRWARLEQDARNFFVQTAEKYHYWDWSGVKNDVLTMQTQEGHDITLTREQALGLYATWRRENSDNGQKAGHLSQGGFVYENAMEQNKKTKEITVDTSKPNRMSDVDMARVTNWLTDEQRAYADEMVRYMSEDMAALGNEVSMTLFGIKKYGEKYYFPYQSSQNYIYTPLGSGAATNDQRLKHSSFTNRTVQFANNPIIASDFTTVWANHVNHMILYGSMCVPLENFNRVYNYKYKETDEMTGEVIGPAKSVKAALEGAYGKQALKYIETLMTDLNGGMRTQTEGVAGWLTSKFKKNAVFASLSVVAQQPSAIVRAMALVDPKYFAPGIAQRGNWDELMKYSGTAIIKDMGGFDTATGRTTRDWLIKRDPVGLKEKGKALVNVKDGSYRDEVLSYLPAKADQLAWTHLWRAVKAETAANNPGLTGEEFFQESARRFDEVISYTQVYDSVLAKSQIMRSKDGASKMVTAFMAEPTVAYNLLYDAFANRGKADSVGRTRAVAAYVATAVVNALLKSVVTAARDDEDKNYGEKYLGELVENIVNDVNPVNLVPYARDAWSIFQGYDVERADMSIISDLKGSIDKIMDEDATPDVIIKEIATTAGAFLGLPVKNVWRDVAAVGNVFNSVAIPFSPEGARYAMLEALPFYDGRTSAYYGRLLDAYIAGDTSEQESLNIYLTTTLGKTDKTVKTQTKTELGKRYKAGQMTDEAAIDLLVDYFGMDDDDAYWQLKEWREKAAHADDEDYSFTRYTALNEALAAGNVTAIKAAQKELMDNGYKQKDVDSETRKAIKAMYKDGKLTFQEAQRMLKAHGGNEWVSGMDANAWYWLEQEYAYDKTKADGAPAWSKYNRLKTAMQTNKDVKGAIKELLSHGVDKGEISGQISDMFKETYRNLYKTNKSQALALQERLLDWYVAAGYKRDDRIKHIKRYWLK